MYERLEIYNNLYTIKERKQLIRDSLEELRTSKGLQQKEVAKLIGLNYQTYCNYENGRSEPPAEILVRLSKLYEVPVDIIVQADNLKKNIEIQQQEIDLYKAQIEELKERIKDADPQMQIALNSLITQLEKTMKKIEDNI